jgi:hypothetical protein
VGALLSSMHCSQGGGGFWKLTTPAIQSLSGPGTPHPPHPRPNTPKPTPAGASRDLGGLRIVGALGLGWFGSFGQRPRAAETPEPCSRRLHQTPYLSHETML